MKKNQNTYQHKAGFEIEKNYFEDFEARLNSRIALEEKTLQNQKMKHGGMKVPSGYFDELEVNLVTKVNTQKESKVINLRSVVNWASAAIILIAITSYLFTQLPNGVANQPTLSLSDVSNESLENYIEESLFGSDLEYYLNGNTNYDYFASLDSAIDPETYLKYIEDELMDEDF